MCVVVWHLGRCVIHACVCGQCVLVVCREVDVGVARWCGEGLVVYCVEVEAGFGIVCRQVAGECVRRNLGCVYAGIWGVCTPESGVCVGETELCV